MKIHWNNDDIRGYLVGTIVLYDNYPYRIDTVDNNNLILSTLVNGEQKTVKKNDPLLDVGSLPLGYVNISPNVYFLQRTPRRQWRQGIREGNIEVFKNDVNIVSTRVKNILHHNGFISSVTGKFPKFKTVKSKDRIFSALSRDVMVKKLTSVDYEVYYQRDLVGSVNSKGELNILKGECSWIIEEELNKLDWKC